MKFTCRFCEREIEEVELIAEVNRKTYEYGTSSVTLDLVDYWDEDSRELNLHGEAKKDAYDHDLEYEVYDWEVEDTDGAEIVAGSWRCTNCGRDAWNLVHDPNQAMGGLIVVGDDVDQLLSELERAKAEVARLEQLRSG